MWDGDLYSIPVEQIKDLHCEMTILNGNIVMTRTVIRSRRSKNVRNKSGDQSGKKL